MDFTVQHTWSPKCQCHQMPRFPSCIRRIRSRLQQYTDTPLASRSQLDLSPAHQLPSYSTERDTSRPDTQTRGHNLWHDLWFVMSTGCESENLTGAPSGKRRFGPLILCHFALNQTVSHAFTHIHLHLSSSDSKLASSSITLPWSLSACLHVWLSSPLCSFVPTSDSGHSATNQHVHMHSPNWWHQLDLQFVIPTYINLILYGNKKYFLIFAIDRPSIVPYNVERIQM